MYDIPHFKAHEQNEVIAFMKAHPFVIICGIDEHLKPVATHVPVLIEFREDKIFLVGHVMKQQLHTKAFEKNNQVLAIFSGNHAYVSATNYKQQNTASTWNYTAVHASGRMNFLNEESLLELLSNLTKNFEQNSNSPALVEKMDENYVKQLMKAIVAFEIEVTQLNHVFKLSQNKEDETKNNIISQLEKDNNPLANSMKQFYHKH